MPAATKLMFCKGLGGDRDQVLRSFMEFLAGDAGIVLTPGGWCAFLKVSQD